MNRFAKVFSLAAAVLVGSAAVVTTADAQTPTGYYVAVPAQAPTRATLVARDTLFARNGNAYVANRAPERDAVLCDAVARATGQLASFTVAGRAYDADQLAKCNAHARGGVTPAGTNLVAR